MLIDGSKLGFALVIALACAVGSNRAQAAPNILVQPSDDTTTVVFPAFFQVSAQASSGSLSYQWYKGNRGVTTDPLGSGFSFLTIPNPETADEGLYWVRVTDGSGSIDSAAAQLTVVPNQPATPFVTIGLFVDRVRVHWNPAAGADQYRIYRESTTPGSHIGTTTGTFFYDTTATPGQNYRYYVSALDAQGDESALSSQRIGFRAAAPLNGSLIPMTDVGGFVFGEGNDRLFVSSSTGAVEVYDIPAKEVIDDFILGGQLPNLDVDPNDEFLLVSQYAQNIPTGVVTKIDLATRIVSDFTWVLNNAERSAFNTTVLSPQKALVTSNQRILSLDIPTGIFTDKSPQNGSLWRNPLRNKVLAYRGVTGGPWRVYDVAGDSFGTEYSSGTALAQWFSVNFDATRIAKTETGGTQIFDQAGTNVTSNSNLGGSIFSPNGTLFYSVDLGADKVRAYETSTWTESFNVDVPGGITPPLRLDIQVRPDGRLLAVEADDGIRLIDLTGFLPDAPPNPAFNVVASDGTSPDQVDLSWSAPLDTIEYHVYRNTVDDSSSSTQIATGLTLTNYVDSTVSPGVVYFYWVEASNTHGTSGFGNSDSGFRQIGEPGGVSSSNNLGSKVVVNWSAVSGATGYRVYQGTTATVSGSERLVGTTAGMTIDDLAANFPANTALYWFVSAVANGIEGSPSVGAEGQRLFAPPATVSATTTSVGLITVDWATVGDPIDGYRVFRSLTDNFASSIQVSTTPTLSFEQDFNAVEPQLDYFYWVRPFSAAFEGELSPSARGFRVGGVYADFVTTYGLTGTEAELISNPDDDDDSNLAEWALGGSDPKDAGVQSQSIGQVRFVDSADHFTLCYLRLIGGTTTGNRYESENVEYLAQGTVGLGDWDQTPIPIAAPSGLPAPPAGYEWGGVRLPFTAVQFPSGFIRIDVSSL